MQLHVGDRIKMLRTQRGLTLKELGKDIGFNYSNLSKIERGQRKPTVEFLESLSSYFKVHISYFFDEKNNLKICPSKDDFDWYILSEEIKSKNISLQELRELADILERSKKINIRS